MAIFANLHPLYQLSAVASVIALAMRGQLQLRAVLLASLALNTADEYFGAPSPEWSYIVWNILFAAINIIVMVELILDRTTIGLTVEDKEVYAAFTDLSPGEFRKLRKLATYRTTRAAEILTIEGIRPEIICFVLSGDVDILKGERSIAVEAPTFIGEIAFLRGGTASATVQIGAGSRLVLWPMSRLERHLAAHPPLKTAFHRLISNDLALKVAKG